MPERDDVTLTGGSEHPRQEGQPLTGGQTPQSKHPQTATLSTPSRHEISDRTLTHTRETHAGQLVDKVNWEIGDIIDGRYEVVDVIGRGGKGIVYKVNHLEWKLELAVKMPLGHLVADEVSKARFIREAQTWVDLGLHPNIVQCWYVRELGGVPRVFMDYIGGGSLKDWLRSGRVRPGEWDKILDLLIQACDGLAYAQEHGVEVHRDVKPGNLLLTEKGELLVTDFGIVKREGGAEIEGIELKNSPGSAESSTITVTGSELGTPEYGAPEQWGKARHADGRADIYALGVILFEMSCGRRPFDDGQHREPPHVLIGRHLSVPAPDPRSFNKNISTDMADLILQCLAKEPDQRPRSMGELRERLTTLYSLLMGKPYRRPIPQAVELHSDALNNRAVSMLDLGRRDEAFEAWKEALKLDPYHPESVYNQSLIEWRECRITDDDVVRRLEEATQSGRRAELYLGYIHLERAAADEAETRFLKALEDAEFATNGSIWRALGDTRMAQEKYADAERAYQKTLDLIPGDFTSLERQTMAQVKTRQRGEQVLFPWRYCRCACEGGHLQGVTALAMAPNGRVVVSGSHDMTLRLWNVVTRSGIWVAKGHEASILTVAISPDGRFVASGSQDMTMRLWELATGKHLWVGRGHTDVITSIAITPNGRFIVSGSRDKTLRLWNIATGKCLWTSEKHNNVITAVAVTPDGRFVLSGHDEENLYLWDINTGKRVERKYYGASLERLGFTSTAVTALVISPDGQWIASGGRDSTVRLWNFKSGEVIHVYKGHEGAVTSVALTADGKRVISSSDDETVRAWDLETEACVWVCNLHEEAVTSVVVDPRSQVVISGSMDMTLRQIDLDTGKSPWTFGGQQGHQAEVTAVAMVPLGRFAVSTSRDLSLRLWDLRTGRGLRMFEGPQRELTAVVVTPDRQCVIGACCDGSLWMWELLSTKRIRVFEGHTADATSVAVTEDGRFLVSGSEDGTVRVWEIASGHCLHVLSGHTAGVTSVAVSENGRFAVSGSKDMTIRFWDITTATCIRVFAGHVKAVQAVALSEKADVLVSGSEDSSIRLWDIESGQCRQIFKGHQGMVSAVAFPADERFIISGGRDCTLRLWECATAHCLRTFTGHTKAVTSLVVTAEGQAVSGSEDGTLRVWELELEAQRYEAGVQVCRQQSHGELQSTTQRFRQQLTWAKTALKSGKPVVAYKYLMHARSVPGYERSPELLEFNAALGKLLPRKSLRGRWLVRTFKGHEDAITTVVVTADGRFAISGSRDTTLRLWDLTTGQCLRIFKGHKQAVLDAVITPDNRFVVSGSADATLRLWDLSTAKCFRVYNGHTQPVTAVAISQYGRFIVSASQDATLRTWNPSSAECVRTMKGHIRSVTCVTVTPDKRLVVSGSEDRTVRLWNHTTGECIRVLKGHRETVTAVETATNGNFLVSACSDKMIRVWDPVLEKPLRILKGHEDIVTALLLTPDDRFLISGSQDRTIRLWDLMTGEVVGTFEQQRQGVTSLAMTADGRFVLAGNEDYLLSQWELDWELDAREALPPQEKVDVQSSTFMNRIASLFNKYEKR